MTTTIDVLKDQTALYGVNRRMRECISRDLGEHLLAAYSMAEPEDRRAVAVKALRVIATIATFNDVYAGAVVGYLVGNADGMLSSLVRAARANKADPTIGPFLNMLRDRIIRQRDDAYIADCEVKASVWRGLSLEETNRILRRQGLENV